MHIEYAKDLLLSKEKPRYSVPLSAQAIVEAVVCENAFLVLALKLQDDRVCGIVGSVQAASSHRFKKVTPAQKYALAQALLGQYGTPRAVYAAAFGVSEKDMFGHEPSAPPAQPLAPIAPQVQAARAQAAAAVARHRGLPALRGTDKQILWAEQIRGEAVEELEDACPEELAELLADNKAKLASYWIASRKDINHLIDNA